MKMSDNAKEDKEEETKKETRCPTKKYRTVKIEKDLNLVECK